VSNVVPNDPYLRLMFHLPESCRSAVLSCSIQNDKVLVSIVRDKRDEAVTSIWFEEGIKGFPTKSLLGQVLLYLL
jgi:hypothetical protein